MDPSKIPNPGKQFTEQLAKIRKQFTSPLASYSIPRISLPEIRMPSEAEKHEYESAGDFVSRLARQIHAWKKALPEDAQPVILAVLVNGLTVDAKHISADGHNVVRIVGHVDQMETMVIAHQVTLQVMCYIKKLRPDEPRYEIGFHTGQEQDAEPAG
ncbi:MAG: hypothetical protein V1876_03610 [Candidatus Peregrinibacteria bacterium]